MQKIDIKNNIRVIFLIVCCIFLLVGCNSLNEEDFQTLEGNTEDYSIFYKLKYEEDKIVFYETSKYGKTVEIDSLLLIKRDLEYYLKNDLIEELRAENMPNYLLFLSTKKDTVYEFDVLANKHVYEINRIAKNKFSTHIKISGLSRFEQTITYDGNYKILRIERILGDKKFVFVR